MDNFDFFDGNTDEPIEVTVTLGELPRKFLSDTKYGHCLRGWNKTTESLVDEPGDDLEEVISARLMVDVSFEPKWTVFCDRNEEGVRFSAGDRAQAFATFIGAYADRQLTWGKNTVLSRITVAENLTASLATASLAARDALSEKRKTDLGSFDDAAKKAEAAAKSYGVPVSEEGAYRAHLDTTAVDIKLGGLSLHDGEIPLRTLGLGSRRMLTLGIEQQGLNEPHITLIDEIEYGLEPHRISRLLKNLKGDNRGQYFVTTHSPVVLRELTVEQLFVAKSENHETTIIGAAVPGLAGIVQGKMRSGAEAFLARNVIVCEGATEAGLCRGLDSHWFSQGIDPFSYTGTASFDAGGGSKVRSAAEAFVRLGYRVAVIADSDANDNFSAADEQALRAAGVCVVWWDGNLSLEEYFFAQLPWEKVISSTLLAFELHGSSVVDQVKHYHSRANDDINDWQDSAELRQAIGKAALGNAGGRNTWFKRQDLAEQWTETIADSFDIAGSELKMKLDRLKAWVSGV